MLPLSNAQAPKVVAHIEQGQSGKNESQVGIVKAATTTILVIRTCASHQMCDRIIRWAKYGRFVWSSDLREIDNACTRYSQTIEGSKFGFPEPACSFTD